jgi:hypothetical protein
MRQEADSEYVVRIWCFRLVLATKEAARGYIVLGFELDTPPSTRRFMQWDDLLGCLRFCDLGDG